MVAHIATATATTRTATATTATATTATATATTAHVCIDQLSDDFSEPRYHTMTTTKTRANMVELQAINKKGNYQQNNSKKQQQTFLIVLLINSHWQLNHGKTAWHIGKHGA